MNVLSCLFFVCLFFSSSIAGEVFNFLPTPRTPHETTWGGTTVGQDRFGKIYTNNHSYVEVATGLNRFDEERKTWVQADSTIELDPQNGGAIAQKAQHVLRLAANANNFNGVVKLTMPDRKQLVMQCLGLALTDKTGKSVYIAEVKDTVGQLVDKNTVVYTDAFDSIHADIQVKMKLGGIEHDVILKEQITTSFVQTYGIDPKTARLEIWHQVLSAPEAIKTSQTIRRTSGVIDEDDTIFFGKMAIVPGVAYNSLLKANQKRDDALGYIAVAKRWMQIKDINFLVESIPFLDLQANLADLPVAQARVDSKEVQSAHALRDAVGTHQPVSLIKSRRSQKRRERMIASYSMNPKPPNGFVIDYEIENTTQTNFTWRGDTTYFVNGSVYLWGVTTLEPGCVIKYTNYNTTNIPQIVVNERFDCRTHPWAPAIFTAKDDDTVGEIIAGSTGTPLTNSYYGYFPLKLASATYQGNIHDFQSRYNLVGIGLTGAGTHNVWNAQIYNCDRGLETTVGNLNARNILLYQTRYAISTGDNETNAVVGEHLTIDTAEKLFNTTGSNSYLYLTNTITCNVTNDSSSHLRSNYVQYVSSTAFAKLGGGYHYLIEPSGLRDAGTTNLTPEMVDILKKTTTYSPILVTNNFEVDTILQPSQIKDCDIPDLGYHYFAIDYMWGDLYLTNATLILTNGVGVGMYGQLGTILTDGAKFYSSGLAQRLNTISRYENFQEVPNNEWSMPYEISLSYFYVISSTTDPDLEFHFTQGGFPANVESKRLYIVTASDNEAFGKFLMKDCQIAHAEFYFQTTSSPPAMEVAFINNVFEYSTLIFVQNDSLYNAFPVACRNNLFRNGTVDALYGSTNTVWSFNDNLFDSTIIFTNGFALTAHNNAFFNTASLGGASNKTLVTIDFVAGPLGAYYYPTAGSNLFTLIDAGSQDAGVAGLHYYTIMTNQITESSTLVDIGFHYAATDAFGNPQDGDGDGLADYLEDTNGNGTTDSGETDVIFADSDGDGTSDFLEWLQGRNRTTASITDTNGTLDLRVFTPLD